MGSVRPTESSDIDDRDQWLVRESTESVTVQFATGVSYSEGLQAVASATRTLSKGDSAFFRPAVNEWISASDSDLKGYYHHLLTGVATYYAVSCVFREFAEQYPAAAATKRIDWTRTEAYVEALSQRQFRLDDATSRLLSGTTDERGYGELVNAVLPGRSIDPEDIAFLKKRTAFIIFKNRACPVRSGNRGAARWLRWEAESALLDFLIQAEIDANPKRFQEIADAERVRTYFVVSGYDDSAADSLTKLLADLMNEEGQVAEAGLNQLNQVLTELGVPTEVSLIQSTSHQLRQLAGIDRAAAAGEFVRLQPAVPVRDSNTAVITFQKRRPRRGTALEKTTPGTFIFDAARVDLLRPIIANVLKRLEFASILKAPTEEDVLNAAGGFVLEGQRGKYLLPTVILDDIRK